MKNCASCKSPAFCRTSTFYCQKCLLSVMERKTRATIRGILKNECEIFDLSRGSVNGPEHKHMEKTEKNKSKRHIQIIIEVQHRQDCAMAFLLREFLSDYALGHVFIKCDGTLQSIAQCKPERNTISENPRCLKNRTTNNNVEHSSSIPEEKRLQCKSEKNNILNESFYHKDNSTDNNALCSSAVSEENLQIFYLTRYTKEDLAALILDSTIEGRAEQTAKYCTDGYWRSGVTILHALKSFTDKEISLFLHINNHRFKQFLELNNLSSFPIAKCRNEQPAQVQDGQPHRNISKDYKLFIYKMGRKNRSTSGNIIETVRKAHKAKEDS